jgi:hypothetical protein
VSGEALLDSLRTEGPHFLVADVSAIVPPQMPPFDSEESILDDSCTLQQKGMTGTLIAVRQVQSVRYPSF